MNERTLHFECDSSAYHILRNAAASIKDTPGLIVEIGTRRGGSCIVMIDGLRSVDDCKRTLICIDPYGNIGYSLTDEQRYMTLNYTNEMRNETIPDLLRYGYSVGLNLVYMPLEDTEYMSRFPDGFPTYSESCKTLESRYALVFFDGPHDTESVAREVDFFAARSTIGTRFVFDDIQCYDHARIEEQLRQHGFELVERCEPKASYKKER